jgi:raffinose/stachyose/melibiose transport system permease protein
MTIKNTYGKIAIFTILVLVALIVLLPLLSMVNISLKSTSEYYNNPTDIVKTPELANYVKAFAKTKISVLFKNSLIFLFFGTGLSVLSAVLVAFPVARKKIKGHKIIYTILISSMMLPPSLIPLYNLMSKLHLINTYHGLIMYYIGSCAAISIFILTGFVDTIPKEMDEAASIDGCGYFTFLFKIIMPLMKSPIATVSMLVALTIWNDFINPFLFLTDPTKRNITSGLYMLKGEFTMSTSTFAAALIIILLPLTVVYIFLQQKITESLTGGAIKG